MDFRLFKRPPESSKEALDIWKECNLCYMEYYFRIRDKLWNWCHAEKERFSRNGRNYYVKWASKSGVKMEAKWEAFFSWMMCACEEQKTDSVGPEATSVPTLQPIPFQQGYATEEEIDGVSYVITDQFSTIEGFFSG
jgi:hypothetical protein